jgi:hypothetical protein
MADIKLPLLSSYWPRFKLTYLVISLDFAIILAFILYVLITDWNIKREAVISDENYVQTTDFAVTVKGLPDISEYKTQDQLRAMLINHFTRIIKEEEQVILKMQDCKEDPSDIVSIHFGLMHYSKYSLLLQIDE